MSDNDDDAQTPTPTGAKPKKNVDEGAKSKQQASSKAKKDSKEKASILKSVTSKDEKAKKKSVKIESPEQFRSAYSDQKSRYRVQKPPKRTQKSHSISQVVPRREVAKRREPNRSTLSFTYEEPSSDRDHHEALEFLEKSSPFHARESLLDLRRRDGKEKFHRHHHHHRKEGTVKRHIHHVKRCRSCLEIENQCECSKEAVRARNSDWAFLSRSNPDPPRTWTNPRLEWLERLEESSECLRDQLEENIEKQGDICCFPFSTFNIFRKKELEVLDFYTKN